MPGRRYDQTVSSGQVAEAGLRGRLPSPGGGCGGHVDARQPWPCTHRPDPALALHSPTRSSPGPAPAPPQWECRWCPQPQPPHPNRCSARWAARWAERTAGLGGRRRGRPQRRRAGCCSLRPAAGRGAAGRCFGAREAWKLAWLHGVAAAGAAHCGGALLSQRCMTGPPAACLRDALALAIPRPGPAMVPALQQALQQQQQQHGGGGGWRAGSREGAKVGLRLATVSTAGRGGGVTEDPCFINQRLVAFGRQHQHPHAAAPCQRCCGAGWLLALGLMRPSDSGTSRCGHTSLNTRHPFCARSHHITSGVFSSTKR